VQVRAGIQFAGRHRGTTVGGVVGWFADFFRLAWGLLYWNTRKTWFQLRRGRSPCPCQNPSDSGRGYETQCDACVGWHRAKRFQRVCPLLVETPAGLRCSANTPRVRPFWGIAAKYYGGAALSAYLVAVLTVFIFLRTIGYPVSIVHVGLPPLWHRVGQARGWFFHDRAQKAFAAGNTYQGLLYLENAYDFDPTNYVAGLSLAKRFQAAQPGRSDRVFERLLREHPDKRNVTAEEWFRALIPRGDFPRIASLAHEQVLADAAHASVWMRALLFASKHTGNDAPLQALLSNKVPAAMVWHPLLELELLVRAGRPAEARALLDRFTAQPAMVRNGAYRFTVFHRVQTLITLREPLVALDVLEKHRGIIDSDTHIMLRLDALAAAGARALLQRELEALLGPRATPPLVTTLCAHLVRYPDPVLFARLRDKVEREALPLNTDTAGAWFSLLCTAGVVRDRVRLAELGARLKRASPTPFSALGVVEAFFRGDTTERRITTFLPILPLPLEVTYALIDRYAEPRTPVPALPKRT
jgi:hypothetical protein